MRKYLAVLLVVTTVFGLGGCAGRADQLVETKKEAQTSELKKGTVITSGKIIAFEGEFIDILTGDMVERYAYDQSQKKDFYLGQNVELVSEAKGNRLNPVLEKDFSKRYTTMGDLLISATGVVKDKNDSKFVIESQTDKVTIEIEGSIAYPVGTKVTVDYVQQGKRLSLITAYNEDTKLTLTILKINRSKSGEMELGLLDGFGKVYKSGTVNAELRLNLSALKVGDTITCYHEGIEDGEISLLKTSLLTKQ